MSFILDALKKLEQKRQQEAIPNLSTIHTVQLHKSKKRPVWPYLIAGALLLNAGILAVWLNPWSSESEEITAASPVVDNQETSAVELTAKEELPRLDTQASVTVKSTGDKLPAARPEPTLKPVIRSQPEPVQAEASAEVLEPAAEAAAADAEAPVISDNEPSASLELTPTPEEIKSLKEAIREEQGFAADETPDAAEITAESSSTRSEHHIPELTELPADQRNDIPAISIFGHIYSGSPSSRLANINGSLVREGDTVSGGLKVKEITINGVIFDYQGRYFKMRAF